ncbi:hypothetical protein F4680DRAFT_465843 [Xylaria scruposa]|nr:hypothetical protein F4680DRAFT_465843 [Xylaria scruposa]
MACNVDDNYLPSLLSYFNPDGQLQQGVNLSIECGICKAGLAITQPADKDHEEFTMLPCGHIFCYSCMTRWFEQKANCPQCRKNMKHGLCRHIVAIQAMQGGPNFNIHRDLEPKLCKVDNMCTDCHQRPLVARQRGLLQLQQFQNMLRHHQQQLQMNLQHNRRLLQLEQPDNLQERLLQLQQELQEELQVLQEQILQQQQLQEQILQQIQQLQQQPQQRQQQ